MQDYSLERAAYEPHFDDLQYRRDRFISLVETEVQRQQAELTAASREVSRLTREVIRDQAVRVAGRSFYGLQRACVDAYDYRLRVAFNFSLTAELEQIQHVQQTMHVAQDYAYWLLYDNPY